VPASNFKLVAFGGVRAVADSLWATKPSIAVRCPSLAQHLAASTAEREAEMRTNEN
jgi:hypothetical protein